MLKLDKLGTYIKGVFAIAFFVWILGAVGLAANIEIQRKSGCISNEGLIKGWLWCKTDDTNSFMGMNFTKNILLGLKWPLWFVEKNSEPEVIFSENEMMIIDLSMILNASTRCNSVPNLKGLIPKFDFKKAFPELVNLGIKWGISVSRTKELALKSIMVWANAKKSELHNFCANSIVHLTLQRRLHPEIFIE